MKIICIGRNYVDHAKELKNPVPTEPVFFLKPDSSLLRRNRPFFYPDFSKDIHYEAEIVVHICKVGKNISKEFAHTYFDKIAIGLDLTARDLQTDLKKKGLPWTKAKGFDNAAPISPFVSLSDFTDINNINFHLVMNGERVQKGNTGEMVFSVDDLIVYLSKFMTLKTGDLIFTGTPAGVGPINIGDYFEAFIEGNKMMHVRIK